MFLMRDSECILGSGARTRVCCSQLSKTTHARAKWNLLRALKVACHAGECCYRGAHMRAGHSYVGHCPRTHGVSVKSMLETMAGEKNGAWSKPGEREGGGERTKGQLSLARWQPYHRKQRREQTMPTTSWAFEGSVVSSRARSQTRLSRDFHNLRPRNGLQTDLSAFRRRANNVSPHLFSISFFFLHFFARVLFPGSRNSP